MTTLIKPKFKNCNCNENCNCNNNYNNCKNIVEINNIKYENNFKSNKVYFENIIDLNEVNNYNNYDCNNPKCRCCHKNFNYYKELEKTKNDGERNALNKFICLNCYDKLEATFDKSENKRCLLIYFCDICKNYIIVGNNNWTCNICGYNKQNNLIPTFKCKICENNYLLNDQLNKCNNKLEEKLVNNKICINCLNNNEVLIDLDINKIPRVIHLHKCPKTGIIRINKSPDNKYKCPDCNIIHNPQIFNHICPKCGNKEDTLSNNWTCKNCGWNGTNYNHKCTNPDCGYEESNPTPQNRWTCPKCSKMPNQQTFKHNCTNCGYNEENAISPLMWTCPNCHYNATYDFSLNIKECNNKCKYYDACKEKENRTKNIYNWCYIGYMKDSGFNNEEWTNYIYNIPCNKYCKNINICENKSCMKNKFGWCENIINFWSKNGGVQNKDWRIYDKLDLKCNENCYYKNNNSCPYNDNQENNILKNKWGWCEYCVNHGNGSKNIQNFILLDVLTYKDEPVTDIIQKLNDKIYDVKDFPGWNKRWCSKCNKFEWHYDTECLVCGNKNKLTNSKFTEIKDIKHYSMSDRSLIDCQTLADKILNKELNITDFPGFNIRFGRVCKDTEDIVTGEIYKLNNSNFVNFKDVEYVLDHSTNEYIPSNKFFNNFDKKVKDLAVSNNEIQTLINEEGFSVEPIIKTADDMWNRDQTDKNLINKGYKYICYIKLFHEKPWIVGKTSTTLIPASPVDFDFKIYNPNNLDDPNYNGAGRIYIHRYYPDELYSDFDYVLIKGFETENEAKEYEKYIAIKYNLFQS